MATAAKFCSSSATLNGSSAGAGQALRNQSRSMTAYGIPRCWSRSPIASAVVVFAAPTVPLRNRVPDGTRIVRRIRAPISAIFRGRRGCGCSGGCAINWYASPGAIRCRLVWAATPGSPRQLKQPKVAARLRSPADPTSRGENLLLRGPERTDSRHSVKGARSSGDFLLFRPTRGPDPCSRRSGWRCGTGRRRWDRTVRSVFRRTSASADRARPADSGDFRAGPGSGRMAELLCLVVPSQRRTTWIHPSSPAGDPRRNATSPVL